VCCDAVATSASSAGARQQNRSPSGCGWPAWTPPAHRRPRGWRPTLEATDSTQKPHEILSGAGYRDVEVRVLPWSDQPDVEASLHRQLLLGASGRRLAAWDPMRRAEFVSRMRLELATLPTLAFLNRSEVLAVTARTP
jgi:hypothetical protein